MIRTSTGITVGLAVAAIGAAALGGSEPAEAVPGANPTANLDVSPNPVPINQTVTFDGSGSTGDGTPILGEITKYEWDLDGVPGYELDTGTASTTSRSYSTPGNRTVRLRVTDGEGDMDESAPVVLAVLSPPTAGFIFEPSTPKVNETITFSSSSSDAQGPVPSSGHRWDLDSDGQYDDATGETITHAFPTPGFKTVGLQVTDGDGEIDTESRTFQVQANAPDAAFSFAPASPLTNEFVSFDGSASTPPTGETLASMTWDLDGDGEFDDNIGASADSSYATPGPRTVSLRVEASGGGFDIATRIVPVGNRAPQASFRFSPRAPNAGEAVELVSTSVDSDGPLTDQAWDLDGDGEFDDATGVTAERTFGGAGTFVVGLRVTDSSGASQAVTEQIPVTSRELELMSPFPVVRLVGKLRASGKTQIRRLVVRAAGGTDVLIRCDGTGCPWEQRGRAIKDDRVRFAGVEKVLSPDVVLDVFATDPNLIGKFTRFKFRHGKPPKRLDRCLAGAIRDPIPCPR
jgi:PKD repeat protein